MNIIYIYEYIYIYNIYIQYIYIYSYVYIYRIIDIYICNYTINQISKKMEMIRVINLAISQTGISPWIFGNGELVPFTLAVVISQAHLEGLGKLRA